MRFDGLRALKETLMDIAVLREALLDPAIYPEPTTTVEVRETHISLVFLTDRYAYKIKKPVNLGFLDFSTLDQRRFYCEQELTLNRRLSSGVYLEVVALHQDHQHCTFADHGQVVDYALKMRRLPPDRSLETLLQRDEATPEMIQALARRMVTFHTDHPLPASSEAFGTLERVKADWEENFAQTADSIGRLLSRPTYVQIQQAVTTLTARHAAWFAQRVQDGRIRDCHGDLRAEHIYFEPGQMQIIDCIEFNQRFRFIDVTSEVAFLAVDLERLGAPAMAHRFVRAYVHHSADVSMYRLLDFYRCYRAYVRGKVTSILLQAAPPPERSSQLQRRAESYFRLAAHYAERITRPRLLLTTGLIASGKSTVAEGIAAALGLDLFSSDHVRKELAGVSPETSQRAEYGAGLYSAAATQRTYSTLADLARQALSRGDSVILDASFAKYSERQRMTALAQELKARCCVVECWAPEAALRARLRARERSPTSISDAREEILSQFQRDYEPMQADEGTCWMRLDTTQSIEQCVQQALAAIHEQRP
jgi:aminoglycoside phosphotransferase family enzyme/predicted kinase